MWQNVKCIPSSDTNVRKYVFTNEGEHGAVAESVLYKYPTYEERTVVCFSVMSGCPMGCRFCGTGEFFIRTLTADEIVAQVQHVLGDTNISPDKIKKLQLMAMSMGEPMLNRSGLEPALRKLHELYPTAALLVSTAAPDVDYEWFIKLSQEIPEIGLQFSVHESNDKARNKLVPFKSKLTLGQIALVGYRWHVMTGRLPYFNYCAHDGNNTDGDAASLVDLFSPIYWQATVSVVCESDETVATAHDRQRQLASDFTEKLLNCGYNVRMFDPAGQDDIGGGCGQLHFVQSFAKDHPDLTHRTIGFGREKLHPPRIDIKSEMC